MGWIYRPPYRRPRPPLFLPSVAAVFDPIPEQVTAFMTQANLMATVLVDGPVNLHGMRPPCAFTETIV